MIVPPAAPAAHAVPTAAGTPYTTNPATQPPAVAAPYKNITIADNAAAITGTIIITSLGIICVISWSLYAYVQCQQGTKPLEVATHMHKHYSVQTNADWKDDILESLRLYPGQHLMSTKAS